MIDLSWGLLEGQQLSSLDTKQVGAMLSLLTPEFVPIPSWADLSRSCFAWLWKTTALTQNVASTPGLDFLNGSGEASQ